MALRTVLRYQHVVMRHLLAIALILSTTAGLIAQQSRIGLEVQSTVDTSNSDISQIIRLWENYLNSKPDSVYLNPYWSESEQREYQPFDLVAYTWWVRSFYVQWLSHCRIRVLSVSGIGEPHVIRTMFYYSLPKDSGKVNVINIMETGARRENGTYKLCNVLPLNTRFWKHEQFGSIRYVFPPDHQFDRTLAERMRRFVDSLAAVWRTPVVPVTYYFADDLDRVAKALGFDYWFAEGNLKTGPRGVTDSKNRIIYSGGTNEWHPHELVHIYVNPLTPNSHFYFHEGYATLVAGAGGHDLLWHIRRNYEYLKNHPEIDALSFNGVDQYVGPEYFIGGMLCKMAEEKGGLPLIRKMMTYGKEDEDLFKAIQETFGVDKKSINEFLRKKLAEYAAR